MKKFFTKKKIIILTAITLITALSVGAFAIFGKSIEEVEIPKNANLSIMTLEKPTTGTPSEYDAKLNLYVAQGELMKNPFSTYTTGQSICSLVNQDIYSERVVTQNATYKKSISYSSMKKVGVQYYINNNQYIVQNTKNIKSIDSYSFSNDEAVKLTEEAFVNAYGLAPRSLSSYVLNDDTILDSFYVGKDENGLNQYKFTLDPTLSTAYIRNEMKTMAGSEKYPVIDEIEFTIWMNDDWQVSKTHNKASYRIEMFGMVISLVEDTTEYFTLNQNPQIPNEDFFKTKIETTETTDNFEAEKDATTILMDAFAPYLDGTTPLSLKVETSGAVKLNALLDLYINASNLEEIKAVADIQNIGKIQYNNKDNKLFVSIPISDNSLDAYLNTNECSESFVGLLSDLGLNLDFEGIDLNSLLSGLSIDEGDTDLTIHFNANLMGFDISAEIILNKETNKITATASLGDKLNLNIKTTSTPLEEVVTEENESSFHNLKPLLDQLLAENLNFGINSDILTGNIKADIFNGKIVASVNLFGKDILVEFSENSLWIEVDGVVTKFDDFKGLMESTLLSSKLGNLNLDVKALLNELLKNLEIEKDETNLVIKSSILNIPLNIYLEISESGLSLKNISTTIFGEDFTLSFTENSTLNFLSTEQKNDSLSLNNLVNLLNTNEFTFNINSDVLMGKIGANISTKTIAGNLTIFGKNVFIEFCDNQLWLQIDGILAEFTSVDNLLKSEIVSNLMGEIDFNLDDILTEIFENLILAKTENSVCVTTKVCNLPINLLLKSTDGNFEIEKISTTLMGQNFELSFAKNENITYLTETQKSNAIIIDSIIDILNSENLSLKIALGDSHNLQLTINLSTFDILGLLDNQLKIKFTNNTLFGVYNDLKFQITLSDLATLINKLITDLKLDLDLNLDFSELKIEDIIKTLTFTQSTDKLVISLEIFENTISLAFDVTENKLALTPIEFSAFGTSFEINEANDLTFDIDTTQNNFVDAFVVVNEYYQIIMDIINYKEITITGELNILSPIENSTDKNKTAINLTSICFNFEDTKNLKIKAFLQIVNTSLDNGTTKTKTYDLELYFVNSRVYFSFDGVSGQFGTNTFDNSKESIISIFNNIPQLKDLIEKLSTLTNINLNVKEWDLYSLLKNITIDSNNNLSINIDLTTIIADASNLSDLIINMSKAENGGIELSSNIENLINDYDVSFVVNILPTTESSFEIENADSYIVFDSINYLLETLANTIALRHFHVTADLNATFIKIASVTIKLDLLVDVYADGTFSAIVTLSHTPDGIGLTDSIAYKNYKCKTILYIEPNYDYIYGERIYKESIFSKEKTEHLKISKETFNANIMDSIFYLLDLSSTITDLFADIDLNFSTDNLKASDIFKNFTYDDSNRKYAINLDLSALDDNLGETNIYITHSEKTETESAKLESISADMAITSVGTLSLNGTLVDQLNQDYGTGLSVENFKTENGSSCTEKTFS